MNILRSSKGKRLEPVTGTPDYLPESHLITIAKDIGITVDPKDPDSVLNLAIACDEMGHELYGVEVATRMSYKKLDRSEPFVTKFIEHRLLKANKDPFLKSATKIFYLSLMKEYGPRLRVGGDSTTSDYWNNYVYATRKNV